MTKFISAFEDFFKSIYELFASIIGTLASVVNAFIHTILGFFSGIINLLSDVLKGAVDLAGGVGKFITSNIVIIGVVAAGGYLYIRTQQGKPVVPAKKTN
ncbi:hypothetical protein VSDG_06238 [Cytospora chrysosperma]|uniref:Uncharacterized protein n=1 Tax=Cytospora chrysosperma TaxID=252740 RepID=A0A423VSK3_CYTCH|nr:hypothetical protein VSDG_06238 [Valsa sordida]